MLSWLCSSGSRPCLYLELQKLIGRLPDEHNQLDKHSHLPYGAIDGPPGQSLHNYLVGRIPPHEKSVKLKPMKWNVNKVCQVDYVHLEADL